MATKKVHSIEHKVLNCVSSKPDYGKTLQTDNAQSIQSVQVSAYKFSKNLGATSKFQETKR
jgi:hypothetical protein